MPKLDVKRIVLGGLVAGVVLNVSSTVVNVVLLGDRYAALQDAGIFLREPRAGLMPLYMVLLFFAGIGIAVLYASVRGTWGAGPKTAALVGLCVGMLVGIPGNVAVAAWSPAGRLPPLLWCLDAVVGYTLAALAAGALYRDAPQG